MRETSETQEYARRKVDGPAQRSVDRGRECGDAVVAATRVAHGGKGVRGMAERTRGSGVPRVTGRQQLCEVESRLCVFGRGPSNVFGRGPWIGLGRRNKGTLVPPNPINPTCPRSGRRRRRRWWRRWRRRRRRPRGEKWTGALEKPKEGIG